ncbi:biliverdin-producing heme oxygenase [Nocardioides sp. AE5]|uniref:biliverdin-producing heme oxygenase n=1 Tax=Nocardioides sp. AE5 TaxID=2962573 RepID=UPI00288156E3|nr:biliverdin-producing heme oxygenase [Nocardioides sp. AE5]MDT0201943.1 biliverdin-producing heme oxygenase [Nocardioides sp. AE5]
MTILDEAVTTQPLSVAMREGSQAEHTAAETSGYMDDLLNGRLNELGYADYLLRLRPIYAALEEVGSKLAGDPAVDAVLDEALVRLATIDADLDHWVGDADRTVDSPAVDAYVARIKATANWAPLFVAHHYTRYLGDLSGGQAIGRILDRTFELDGKGIAFYAFTAIEKVKPYKDNYRAALDTLGADLDEDQKARIVDEVKVAFNLNQALFAELGANLDTYRR